MKERPVKREKRVLLLMDMFPILVVFLKTEDILNPQQISICSDTCSAGGLNRTSPASTGDAGSCTSPED